MSEGGFYFASATVADVVLADHVLGLRVHYATKVGRLWYDGQRWSYRLGPGRLTDANWQVVVWLREWLTQGVIELQPDYRARRIPGSWPIEVVLELALPLRLVFTDQWGDPHYAHRHNLWNCNCARTETV